MTVVEASGKSKRYEWMYRINWWGVGLILTLVIMHLTHELWVLAAYFVGIAADMTEHILQKAEQNNMKCPEGNNLVQESKKGIQ